MYVKMPRKCGNISFFPKKICMVPSSSPLTYIATGIQWQIYKKDLNPDKPLNRKNTLSMILSLMQSQHHFRSRRYSDYFLSRQYSKPLPVQTASCNFRSRRSRKPQMNMLTMQPPSLPLHFSRKKKGSHFDSDSLTVNTCPCTLTFLLPFSKIILDQIVY